MALETQKIIQAITPYMRKCLFKRKRKYFYKILENLVFCVEFEKPGELIYVHYYVVPLYIPHECRSFTYGNRVIVNSNHIVFKPTREVDDGDIIAFCGELAGQGRADLAVACDDNVHRGLLNVRKEWRICSSYPTLYHYFAK